MNKKPAGLDELVAAFCLKDEMALGFEAAKGVVPKEFVKGLLRLRPRNKQNMQKASFRNRVPDQSVDATLANRLIGQDFLQLAAIMAMWNLGRQFPRTR